jgi:hypothetical protein
MRELMAASAPPNSPQMPAAMVTAISWVTGIFMGLFMLALPLALLGIFLRGGVRQTLEYFDPHQRWTDACPTPVLALAAWMVVLSVGEVLYALYTVFPAFGYLITGPAGVAAQLLLAAAFAATALGVYRLRRWAWWAAGALVVFWVGTVTVTFSRVPWDEFLRRAGYDQAQIDMMMKFGGAGGIGTISTMAVLMVALLVYLVYLRKYFFPVAPPAPAIAPAPPPDGSAQLSAAGAP